MTAVGCRRATLADVDALVDLERRAAASPWSDAAVRSALAGPATHAWLAEPPLGHVVYTVVADEGEVLTLAVAPEARRKGVGRALLGAVHEHWNAAGVVHGWLEVRADNTAARALYEGHGWTEAGVRRAYYGDGVDAVVYRWDP